MMNMAKLGIVSRAGNYFHSLGNPRKQRAGGLMRYTLCVFQGWARRNGSRNGFAFDIPAISGRALFSVGELVRKQISPGTYVIPGQTLTGEPSKSPQNSPQSLMACASRPKFPRKITVPPFSDHFNGFPGRFLPGFGTVSGSVSGGCHE